MPLAFVIGAIVNGALYLVAVIVVGLVDHNRAAVLLAIGDLAVVYLSHSLALMARPHQRADRFVQNGLNGLFWVSILVGALAGLSLIG